MMSSLLPSSTSTQPASSPAVTYISFTLEYIKNIILPRILFSLSHVAICMCIFFSLQTSNAHGHETDLTQQNKGAISKCVPFAAHTTTHLEMILISNIIIAIIHHSSACGLCRRYEERRDGLLNS